MSLINILKVDIFNSFIIVVLSSLVCFLHYGIGNYFFKKSGLYTSCLIGLVLNAAVATILVSFIASVAKYQIYLFILISSILTLIKIRNNLNKILLPKFENILFIITTALVSFLTINELNIVDYLPFNGHENYYWGISAEIFKSDYFHRLRFFDNYPYTWSKFHFFNGCITAVIQAMNTHNNYATFLVAKGIALSLFITVIFENTGTTKLNIQHSIVAILILILFVTYVNPFLFSWSYFTSSYTSISLLILGIIFLYKKENSFALFFILTFSLSTSRSLLPGLGLSIFLFLQYINELKLSSSFYKNQLKIKYIKFIKSEKIYSYLILLASILMMVFSGNSVINPFLEFKIISFYGIFQNFFNEAWFYLMAPTITHVNDELIKSNYYDEGQSSIWYGIFYLSIFIFTIRNIKSTDISLSKYKIRFLLVFFVEILILSIIAYKDSYKAILIFFYFILPANLLFLLTPIKIIKYFYVFISISLVQLLIFKSSISIVNWHIIEWLIIFGFIFRVNTSNMNIVNLYMLISFLVIFTSVHYLIKSPIKSLSLLGYSELYNSPINEKIFIGDIIINSEKKLSEIKDCMNYFKIDKKINDVELVVGLMGFRSHYHEFKSRNYSITLDFLDTKENIKEVNRCN